ncbi:NADP-dependent oxidoreductase [Mumia zhuanghuii]|uniref:NADP-dependent oxidoreductase n=1 Tax=Mumia zhuanghuii TaxID=2585211 RepID=A0A5C4LW38_9ACTN|nr:NADP-dependent oxidoreductase [Mumia zhuanghuii]TNC22020.1 NADP-dependent oxidoreductase [Mumia zhuanghuii]
MRAIAYDEFGSADVLSLRDLPEPHIGPDTVVVKVVAAGVNPVDYKVREGYLQGLIDVDLPAVPGWDVAGVVEKVGLDTPEVEVGDEVFAYARKDVVSGGTLAEYVAVPVRTLAKKPSTVGFEEAAGVPLAGLTALQTIRRSGLAAGQTVLVHAAAGGVGSFAVQLAVHAGARVVGTASERNHDYVRSLGAEPITYGDGLVERAQATAPDGFDVILDYVGGEAVDTAPDLLADGGRIVSITDARARDELGGEYVWVRPDADDLARLATLIDEDALKVEVAEVFDLEHAADAHRAVERGHTRGKVVVRIA